MTLQEALKDSCYCKRRKFPHLDTEKFGEHSQYVFVTKANSLKDLDLEDLFADDWEPCK